MHRRSRIAFLFLALAVSLAAAKNVGACVCPGADDTVISKFEAARAVVIARAVSVERVPGVKTFCSGNEVVESTETAVEATKMVVVKVYKGNLKVGDELHFGQGERGSCFERFDHDDVGAEFLFYLTRRHKAPRMWYANGCGETKPLPGFNTGMVEDAADDLSFLEKMDRVRGKTRISGTLVSYQWSPSHGGADFKKMAGRKVSIIGKEKTYESETNKDGVYELYGLPPGRYTVNPEMLKGWEIDYPSAWGGGGSGSGEEGGRFQVTLKPGRHAYFDFIFKVDNRVRGRVLDTSGRPMKSVCVDLLPAEGRVSEHFKRTDCTNADGVFEVDEIPFGSYLMVVNKDDRISPYEPFRRFYYPGVYEREKATVITIAEGDELEAFDLRIPEMKDVVTIEGVLLSSDGRPVSRAGVYFKAENTDEPVEGAAFTRTDDDGRFSLRVLKALGGDLYGEVTLNESEFKSCPRVIRFLQEKGSMDWRNVRTDAVKIRPLDNVHHVELKLPFPSCGGATIVSRIRID